jgi:Flp pilus assembly protein TadG
MRSQIQRRASVRVTSAFKTFIAAKDGVAAVEFGLIVPVMLVLFLGCVELSQGVAASRRVSQAAGTAGDLVAQVPKDTTPTNTYIQNIMDVSSYILAPYNTSTLKMEIKSIISGATATSTREVWTCKYDGASPNVACTCPTTTTAYVLPTGLVGANDGVIVASVEYGYRPLVSLNFFVKNPSTMKLTEKLYLKPRNSGFVFFQKPDTTKCT